MKKSVKIIISIAASIVVLWGVLVTVEAFRFNDSAGSAQKPIFVLKEEYTENNETIYYGIGYHVRYSFGQGIFIEKSDDWLIGAEFFVFNKCMYAWVS